MTRLKKVVKNDELWLILNKSRPWPCSLSGLMHRKSNMVAARKEKKRTAFSELDINELGTLDSMRYQVLTAILREDYDNALHLLNTFLESDSPYPNFKLRVERYIAHAGSLVHAIRNKREFPGFNSLTRSKQQELKEKYKEHFQELKMVLVKIEKSMSEIRVVDARSTKIVVKSIWLSVSAVFISGLIMEVVGGAGNNAFVLFDQQVTLFLDYIFKQIGIG